MNKGNVLWSQGNLQLPNQIHTQGENLQKQSSVGANTKLMSKMQIIQSKLNGMLEQDRITHKYYNKKLAPNIKNEKIFRRDILEQQENKEEDIKNDIASNIALKFKTA